MNIAVSHTKIKNIKSQLKWSYNQFVVNGEYLHIRKVYPKRMVFRKFSDIQFQQWWHPLFEMSLFAWLDPSNRIRWSYFWMLVVIEWAFYGPIEKKKSRFKSSSLPAANYIMHLHRRFTQIVTNIKLISYGQVHESLCYFRAHFLSFKILIFVSSEKISKKWEKKIQLPGRFFWRRKNRINERHFQSSHCRSCVGN